MVSSIEAILYIVGKGYPVQPYYDIFSRTLILEHPCNLMLCSEEKCHSNKTQMLPYILVGLDKLLPFGSELFGVTMNGMVCETIFSLKNSTEYNNMQKKLKSIFMELLVSEDNFVKLEKLL